jgi:hypothetical protein
VTGYYELDRPVIRGAVEIPGADIRHAQRACDADRNRYISHLGKCHQLGYIPGDAFTARMEAAAECVTHDQLAGLMSDLPALVPVRARLREQVRGLGRTKLGRRWLHIAGIVAALCWAIAIPIAIYTATGTAVIYGHGKWAWEGIAHPAIAITAMWLFIITGVVGLIVDLGWWISWEDVL